MASSLGERLSSLFSVQKKSERIDSAIKVKKFPIDENLTCVGNGAASHFRCKENKSDPNHFIEEKADFYALHNFKPNDTDELELVQNDGISLIRNYHNNRSLVKNLRTKYIGFVPTKYIAPIMKNIESQEWFWSNVSRETSINFLKNPRNQLGSFLLRKSESSNKGIY